MGKREGDEFFSLQENLEIGNKSIEKQEISELEFETRAHAESYNLLGSKNQEVFGYSEKLNDFFSFLIFYPL